MEIEGEMLVFVLIFLAVCAGFYFFVLRDYRGEEEKIVLPEDNSTISNVTGSNFTVSNQTAPNQTASNKTVQNVSFVNITELHWDHMPLTYRFVNVFSECEGAPIVEMKEAFVEVTEASDGLVGFVELAGSGSADIEITCVDKEELLDMLVENETCEEVSIDYRTVQFSGYEVLDEGDYLTSLELVGRNDSYNVYELCYVEKSKIKDFDWSLLEEAKINVSKGVIYGGRKVVYTINSEQPYCSGFPAKEVHDVLHLFGFAHPDTPTFDEKYGWFSKDFRYFKDVMFPYTYCAYVTEINDNYADCLKYIYSNGAEGEGCAGVNFAS